ncbi:MAG TPA: translation initiation factor IF-2 [Bacteroidia bacterium]|nr:translation initiation factor IF-2 [Bacteroidia bacterium]
MAEGIHRLSKVAKELNVSVSTLVDFLNANGFKIDSNPNGKITDDQYTVVRKEYEGEKKVKDEAKQLQIDKPYVPEEEAPRKKVQEEVVVKAPTPAPVVEPREKIKLEAPKITGKIDLPETPAKKGRGKKKVEEEEKKVEPEPPIAKVEPVEIPPPPAPESLMPKENFVPTQFSKLEGPTIIGKIDLPKPVASSAGPKESGPKKRKRIFKKEYSREDVANNATTTPGTSAPRRPGSRPPERRPELTDEEIQAQIKETLARLSGTGKSKAAKYRREKRQMISEKLQQEAEKEEQEKKTLKVTEFVSANELAKMMNMPVQDVISTCMNLGLFVSINQRLDAETITIVAEEFGFGVEFVSVDVQEAIKIEDDKPEDLLPRSPIVTVMGHVDHGKTSLLDYIRKTNVIAGEAGGITQHIGAYNVTLENGKKITFLDTPGHEAFTAMRARGAQVTDVAIIVVAADDGVMPQTTEAINHAQAAGVPMIFAINKIDKPGANPNKIKEALAGMNILVEDWGGKFQVQEISAKKGTGISELLEKVLLEAEILDMKANPNKKAYGVVIESALDKGKGYVSTMLVEGGTLHVGDIMVAGCFSGKVKAMHNERNMPIGEAPPAMPALILGLDGAPQAGDQFHIVESESEAREIATKRSQLQREQGLKTRKHITLDEIGRRLAIGDFKELNVIVKGDFDGSIEALSDSLLKLSSPKIQVNIVHKGVGAITESDVLLASASNAIILGFQVRPSLSARRLAEQEQIDIRLYSIIYNAINEVKTAMEGMLSPEVVEKITCNIEVREVFKVSKVGTVAGCYVLSGKVTRNTKVRVIRDGIVIHTGDLGSLKRFKDDVKEVPSSYECGLNIANFNDINVGDIIEGYEQVEVKAKL